MDSEAASKARLTTSVCTGALLLARAGLLRGDVRRRIGARTISCQPRFDIVVERHLRVVDDGIVTSAGVAAGIDMALPSSNRFTGRRWLTKRRSTWSFPANRRNRRSHSLVGADGDVRWAARRGHVGAGPVSVANNVLEHHGGLQGVVSQFEKTVWGRPSSRGWGPAPTSRSRRSVAERAWPKLMQRPSESRACRSMSCRRSSRRCCRKPWTSTCRTARSRKPDWAAVALPGRRPTAGDSNHLTPGCKLRGRHGRGCADCPGPWFAR